jgi:uncharacterized protein YllA (UPF0747 family)
VALLINVFPVADIIHHQASAFQLKEHAVIAGAQAVLFILEAFQFFDVAGQILLRAIQFRANQTPRVFWQRAELLQCRFNEINFVAHLSATINLNSHLQRKWIPKKIEFSHDLQTEDEVNHATFNHTVFKYAGSSRLMGKSGGCGT